MKKFLFLFNICLYSLACFSQSISAQYTYDFSNSIDTQRSEINWVLAENSYVIIAGSTQQLDAKPTAFVAKIDWNGNVLWKNELPVPANCRLLDIDGGNNLLRTPDGQYILGGVVQDTTTRSIATKQPFLYRFGADGSPGAFQYLIDTLNRHYGAMYVGADGKVAMANLIRLEDDSAPILNAHPQLTILSAAGVVQSVNIPDVSLANDIESIQAIITDSIMSRYILYGQRLGPEYRNYHFAIDGSGYLGDLYVGRIGNTYYGGVSFLEPPRYQFKLIKSRDDRSLHYLVPISSSGGLPGIGYERLSSTSLAVQDTNVVYMPEDTLLFFSLFDGHLSLIEAKNSDVIYTKSVTQFLGADTLQKFTAMVRLDTAAEVRSIQYIRKITDTVAGIYQFINSIAQSPDGSKYVLAGNIENHGVRHPGVWDTVGSTSWVVLMAEDPLAIKSPIANKLAVNIYPNPSQDQITIALPPTAKKAAYTAIVSNATGHTVLEQIISNTSTTMNIGSLASGAYWIAIYQDGVQVAAEKLVKR